MAKGVRRCGLAASLGVALGVMLWLVPVQTMAQVQDPDMQEGPWRLVLKDQIKREKACDLNEVLLYEELPLGDDVGIKGRVSCLDGREFDFARNRKHQKFRIELCEPAVC